MVYSEKAIVKYHYHSVLSIIKTLSHRDTSQFKPVTKNQMPPKEKVAKAPAGTKQKPRQQLKRKPRRRRLSRRLKKVSI